ncbi:hypothetical protein [Hyphomicrobium sp.]|uniref:hypothetical protein n=1 Tax=Hyphomicrobium sp. TaxID=82 RepID=UPI0025C4337F|nr:hypothetical protein [Hyphomicrobium sp.]MCC7253986.1 hypothetical protein [Hyphomicrobium sp.]
MRTLCLVASFLALAATAPSVIACDGKAEVEAAFIKQQKQPWRTEVVTQAQDGTEQRQRFDFQPPDKMYRKATAGGESIETIGISKWAWSNLGSGAGWEELQPMHARVVTLQVQEAFAPPRVTADFACLGDVTFEGKAYRAYQTAPEKVDTGEVLARTIYVDPETGLPAFNVVGAPDASGDPIVKGVFTYPTDINIEKPY